MQKFGVKGDTIDADAQLLAILGKGRSWLGRFWRKVAAGLTPTPPILKRNLSPSIQQKRRTIGHETRTPSSIGHPISD